MGNQKYKCLFSLANLKTKLSHEAHILLTIFQFCLRFDIFFFLFSLFILKPPSLTECSPDSGMHCRVYRKQFCLHHSAQLIQLQQWSAIIYTCLHNQRITISSKLVCARNQTRNYGGVLGLITRFVYL